jgi:hypothetical protein
MAPELKSKELKTLNIQNSEIIKVVIHSSKQLHIIFLYTKPSCARYIAEQLQMSQTNEKCKIVKLFLIDLCSINFCSSAAPYFSPLSRSEPQKKIVFLAEVINEKAKSVIKSIYSRSVLEEINNRDANQMLVRSTGIPLTAPSAAAAQNTTANESSK